MASLIAFRGDSTLFVDAQSLSMLVIDGNGEVGRVMSVPRAQDAMMLAAGGVGAGAFYSNGHLVYPGHARHPHAGGERHAADAEHARHDGRSRA
jgi:hypothetical protein